LNDVALHVPRKARIGMCGVASARTYASGALNHNICRGIEKSRIFRDDNERDNFIDRLGGVISETNTPCYTWALIPNHCYWAAKELEMSGAKVAQKLKITNSAVSRSVARGEKIASEMNLKLMEV